MKVRAPFEPALRLHVDVLIRAWAEAKTPGRRAFVEAIAQDVVDRIESSNSVMEGLGGIADTL